VAGAALDAALRAGMLLPAMPEAAPAGETLFQKNPLFALKILGQLCGLKKYPL